MFVCCECCVLSGRGLCDELITCPEEPYRLWWVVACDLETSWIRRPWSNGGAVEPKQTNKETNRAIRTVEADVLLLQIHTWFSWLSKVPSIKVRFSSNNHISESRRLNFASLWQVKFLVLIIEGLFQLTDSLQQSPSAEAIYFLSQSKYSPQRSLARSLQPATSSCPAPTLSPSNLMVMRLSVDKISFGNFNKPHSRQLQSGGVSLELPPECT